MTSTTVTRISPVSFIHPSNRMIRAITRTVSRPYERHPIAKWLPPMDPSQLDALVEDVKQNGLMHDMVLFEGKLLDGGCRQEACAKSGITPRYVDFQGNPDDAFRFVITENLHRRHFTDEQRGMMAAQAVNTEVGSNQHSLAGIVKPMTVGRASWLFNANVRTVGRYRTIARTAGEVADAVVAGRIKLATANKIVELPPGERAGVLSLDGNQRFLDREATVRLKAHRRSRPVLTPEGRFDFIVADVPWPIRPEPSYATMTLDEIKHNLADILVRKAADNCGLFLWATQATRESAEKMLKELGWKVREFFTWHKSNGRCHPGRPFQNAEFVILAEKGSPKFVDIVGFKTCFYGGVGRHSEKPAEFFEMVRRATAGRRLELFARRPHPGFEPHGNQIDWSERTESSPAIRSVVSPDTPCGPIRTSKFDLSLFEEWLHEVSRPLASVGDECASA